MDLFTHVVFAYLLSFVLWGPASPQYIAAGAMAGGLPDADILFAPLWKKLPILRHHGITHSVLGVTLVASFGSILVPYVLAPFIPGVTTTVQASTTLRYLVAMELGGLSHVFLDGFTNFAVPPWIPFSKKEYHLEADMAIDLAMTALTVVTLVTLGWEHGTVPFHLWVLTGDLLAVIYAAYLILRGTGRFLAGRAGASHHYPAVVPTGNPLVWFLVEEEITPEHYRIRYQRYVLGRGYTGTERSLDVTKALPPGPVGGPAEALSRSYVASMEKNPFLRQSYHFGDAKRNGESFDVTWYSIEFRMLGRSPGVRARVDARTGKVEILPSRFLRIPSSARS